MNLNQCHNIADLRQLAKKRVPKAVFDYLDGAAADEVTKRRSIEAFHQYQLVPNALSAHQKIDTSVTLMGQKLKLPLFMSPTAIGRFFHRDGEIALGKVAEKFGTQAVLSTIASTSIEEYKQHLPSQKWYQLYILKDRGLTDAMLQRCENHENNALILTIDTPVGGRRERDLRSGMTIPPALNLATILEAGLHPSWWIPYLFGPKLKFANIEGYSGAPQDNFFSMASYMNHQFDLTINWQDVAKYRAKWSGYFAIKGVTSLADAKKGVDIGVDCIILSTHGGRQLDGVPCAMDLIQEIRQSLGDDVEIVVDGGIRRGMDLIKAIALGATACSTGRPFLYGLCANGLKGVDKSMQLLIDELNLSMTLMGYKQIAQITEASVRKISPLSIPKFNY